MTYLELPFRGKVEDRDLWNHLTRWKKVGWIKYAICPRERIIFVKSILPKIINILHGSCSVCQAVPNKLEKLIWHLWGDEKEGNKYFQKKKKRGIKVSFG